MSDMAGAPRLVGEGLDPLDCSGSNEAALVERLRQGDDEAYEVIVRAYGSRMLSVARRLLRNEEDARDAVQDAFLSAFRSIGAFEASSQVGTWLHRILVNAALMKLRTRRRKPEESIEAMLPTFLPDGHRLVAAAEWADAGLHRSEMRAIVRNEIDALPEAYRTVLLLRDIEELDTGETAGLLGISANAVKVRLHRARQALRERLDRGPFRKGPAPAGPGDAGQVGRRAMPRRAIRAGASI